jgi:endonuclease III
VPLDEATLRCVRRLGLIDSNQEDLETVRASLEHIVPKAKGPAFTDAISTVAEEACHEDEPKCRSCPLAGECATGQEATEGLSLSRAHRPKPR